MAAVIHGVRFKKGKLSAGDWAGRQWRKASCENKIEIKS
jgi:hypothetical protein